MSSHKNQNILTIQTVQIAPFRTLMTALKDILLETNITFTPEGISGAVLQMFNHGTITAMLFILVGVIYDRAHHRDINGFGGLFSIVPRYGVWVAFAFFAALGLPGLSGFVSEVLVFLGSYPTYPGLTIAALSGVILGAAYLL